MHAPALSARHSVTGVLPAAAALPAATGGQIAKMAVVARGGCLRQAPTYSEIPDALTVSGFAHDKLGVWRDAAFQKNGVPGRLQTAQARGRTVKMTVTLED